MEDILKLNFVEKIGVFISEDRSLKNFPKNYKKPKSHWGKEGSKSIGRLKVKRWWK